MVRARFYKFSKRTTFGAAGFAKRRDVEFLTLRDPSCGNGDTVCPRSCWNSSEDGDSVVLSVQALIKSAETERRVDVVSVRPTLTALGTQMKRHLEKRQITRIASPGTGARSFHFFNQTKGKLYVPKS